MKLFFSIFFSLYIPVVHSQTVQWARQGGGSGNDLGEKISTDAAGNSYITGYFQNTVTFGPFSLTNTPTATNTFFAKYDALGNILWLRQISGSQNAPASVVYCPAQSCIYLAGKFAGSITLGSYTLTTYGNNDCYFARYDLSGNCIWAVKAGSINGDRVDDIDCDVTGNLIATGTAWTGGIFGSFIVPSHPLYQTFTTSVSPTGNFLWLSISCFTPIGSTATVSYPSIKTDISSNIYISGSYTSTCTFGTQTFTTPGPAGVINIFLQKLSPAGTILWTVVMNGMHNSESACIATDVFGNAYVTGNFLGSVDFGGITKTVTGPLTKYDVFLAKYDPSGNLIWVQQYGNTGNDNGKSVAVLSNGNILLAGYYTNNTQIGSSFLTSAGGSDGFIALTDPAGNPYWAASYGGASGDLIMSAVPDNNSSIYCTGYFTGTASYGSFTLASSGVFDVSVYKIGLPAPLPVELLSFTVASDEKKHAPVCKWTTVSETNNSNFTLEKSKDGASFQQVIKINGAGNTTSIHEYKFMDVNPYEGLSYYRLSQTDFDGRHEILKTVPFRFASAADFFVQCDPAIGAGDFTLISNQPIAEIKVMDIKGKVVKVHYYSSPLKHIVLSLAGLKKGMYFIRLNAGMENYVEKIIIE